MLDLLIKTTLDLTAFRNGFLDVALDLVTSEDMDIFRDFVILKRL